MHKLADAVMGLTVLCACFQAGPAVAGSPEEVKTLAQTIRSVDQQGQGHAAATKAIQQLTTLDAEALPALLDEIDLANSLAANWLLGAFESIAERTLRDGGKLPTAELERFVLDRSKDAKTRRLAYEWLLKVDPSAEQRLIPGMLDDPSADMRRDAVRLLIDEAKDTGDAQAARELYSRALTGVVHDDQVKTIVAALEEHGQQVDVQKHFGFLPDWQLVGPFENGDGKGFDVAYPPEHKLDLQAKYEVQTGTLGWVPLSTEHNYGIVDIAKDFGPHKGAVVYAVSEFQSPQARPVQVRLGTPNAWKMWLNGELLFAREEYHRAMSLDQYRVDAELKQGHNVLLLKVCQNEQEQDWAQRYQFQLRVCDQAGSAVHVASQQASVRDGRRKEPTTSGSSD